MLTLTWHGAVILGVIVLIVYAVGAAIRALFGESRSDFEEGVGVVIDYAFAFALLLFCCYLLGCAAVLFGWKP